MLLLLWYRRYSCGCGCGSCFCCWLFINHLKRLSILMHKLNSNFDCTTSSYCSNPLNLHVCLPNANSIYPRNQRDMLCRLHYLHWLNVKHCMKGGGFYHFSCPNSSSFRRLQRLARSGRCKTRSTTNMATQCSHAKVGYGFGMLYIQFAQL